MDEVSSENSALSTGWCSAVKPMLLPRCHLKEVQSMVYIENLFFLDF